MDHNDIRTRVGFGVSRRVAREAVDLIKRAEAAGVATAWSTMNALGNDLPTIYAAAAVQTERIALGTAIVPAFTRHPLALASQALVLENLAPAGSGSASAQATGRLWPVHMAWNSPPLCPTARIHALSCARRCTRAWSTSAATTTRSTLRSAQHANPNSDLCLTRKRLRARGRIERWRDLLVLPAGLSHHARQTGDDSRRSNRTASNTTADRANQCRLRRSEPGPRRDSLGDARSDQGHCRRSLLRPDVRREWLRF